MAERQIRWWVLVLAISISLPLIAADQHAPVILQISGGDIAAIISALGVIAVQLRGQNEARRERAELRADLGGKMDAVKVSTDGIVTKLSAAKLDQGRAEGHAAGLEAGREEAK
jgi:hypothetical protein